MAKVHSLRLSSKPDKILDIEIEAAKDVQKRRYEDGSYPSKRDLHIRVLVARDVSPAGNPRYEPSFGTLKRLSLDPICHHAWSPTTNERRIVWYQVRFRVRAERRGLGVIQLMANHLCRVRVDIRFALN